MSEAKNDLTALLSAEVRWYRTNGRFPSSRIARTASGCEYVVGDWSWNRNRQNTEREYIEHEMSLSR